MKKLLGLLCVIFIFALIGCGSNNTQETTVAGKELAKNTYETPYGNLPIPDSYIEKVNVEVISEDPYAVAFYNKDSGAKLYTIYYGEEHGFRLGTLETDGKETALYLESVDLDSSDAEYELNIVLQADINEILDKLEENGNFTKGGE